MMPSVRAAATLVGALLAAAAVRVPVLPGGQRTAEAVGQAAPAAFHVTLETTKGDVVLGIRREWAPIGVDRSHELVRAGYYDDTRIFRVSKNRWAQFGCVWASGGGSGPRTGSHKGRSVHTSVRRPPLMRPIVRQRVRRPTRRSSLSRPVATPARLTVA
jgi:hypothetical protein